MGAVIDQRLCAHDATRNVMALQRADDVEYLLYTAATVGVARFAEIKHVRC